MFPYEIKRLEENIDKELVDDFYGEKTGFCEVGPQKWVLPAAYMKHAEGYYTMPLREDDVWIVTYPRSGTTLTQELIWLINNDFDYKRSSEIALEFRFPFYEFSILHHEEFHKELEVLNNNDPKVVEKLRQWREPGYIFGPNMKSPRHLKTHLPFSLLPPRIAETCKVIYVARHPRDVAVSYYHHNRLLRVHGFLGNFEKYWDYFEKDLLVFSPYWNHVLEGWERRNDKNVLFLFYEEFIKELPNVIKKIASFLNKSINENQMETLMKHLQIDNFRKNVPVMEPVEVKGMTRAGEQGFIRKGKIGDSEDFTPELLKRANKWIESHLSKTDLRFPCD